MFDVMCQAAFTLSLILGYWQNTIN